MPSNLKKLIEERRAKTGEPHAVAKRNVRAKLKAERETNALHASTAASPETPDDVWSEESLSLEEMALRMGYAPPKRERYVNEPGFGFTMTELMSRAKMPEALTMPSAIAAVAQSYGGVATAFERAQPSAMVSVWQTAAERVGYGKDPFGVGLAERVAGYSQSGLSAIASQSSYFGGRSAVSNLLDAITAGRRATSNLDRMSTIYEDMLRVPRALDLLERTVGKQR